MLTSNEGKALYWGISAWERKRKHTKSTTVSRPKLEDGSPSLLEWHGKRLWKFCQWSMKPLSNGAKRHRFVAVHRRKVSLVSPLHYFSLIPGFWKTFGLNHIGSKIGTVPGKLQEGPSKVAFLFCSVVPSWASCVLQDHKDSPGRMLPGVQVNFDVLTTRLLSLWG